MTPYIASPVKVEYVKGICNIILRGLPGTSLCQKQEAITMPPSLNVRWLMGYPSILWDINVSRVSYDACLFCVDNVTLCRLVLWRLKPHNPLICCLCNACVNNAVASQMLRIFKVDYGKNFGQGYERQKSEKSPSQTLFIRKWANRPSSEQFDRKSSLRALKGHLRRDCKCQFFPDNRFRRVSF